MRNVYLLFLFFSGFYSFSQNDMKYWLVIWVVIFTSRNLLIVHSQQYEKHQLKTSRIHYQFFRYMRNTKITDISNTSEL